jgi:hypothetical protein
MFCCTMTRNNLRSALDEIHADAMVRQAETIRDWPIAPERHHHAMIHVRLALWEQQIGRVSDDVLQRVYSILHFVMPDDGAFADEAPPLETLEREAEWELAYHDQLQRQLCEECGDGLCPVDDPYPSQSEP